VRLHISGTPGAIVHLDGQPVGPIPLSVQLRLHGPRRVVLSARRSGHQPYLGELVLRPADARRIVEQEIWLPPYRLLDGPHPRLCCRR
jgi:hypothetical protein